jgi:YVTN family beta-propeller protein
VLRLRFDWDGIEFVQLGLALNFKGSTNMAVRQGMKVAGWCVASLLAAGIVFAIILIYPATPGAARSLEFKGFILLPRGALLTVLDYLSINEKRLFVANERNGDVYKIALHEGSLPGDADVSVFALEPATHGVVVDPSSGLAFVSRSEANTVDVFDPGKMQLSTRIPVADDPDGIFYEPINKLVYVASGDAKVATLIDPATRSTVSTIPLGGKPEFAAFDPQTKLMYQNLADTNTLVALDLEKKAVTQSWALDKCLGPSGMDIDESNRLLFIVCARNNILVLFDITKKQVAASFPIGGGPDSVVFDAGLHRIYTTGKSGVLTVLQQDSPNAYRIIDSVRLHYGAHTLTVDPATHTLYVGYASLAVRARIAVFQPLK